MTVEIAKAPLCQSARYAHAEINRALYHDMTLGKFLECEHLPNHNFRPKFTYEQITIGAGEIPRYHHDVCHALLALAYKKMGIDTKQYHYWYTSPHLLTLTTFMSSHCNPFF